MSKELLDKLAEISLNLLSEEYTLAHEDLDEFSDTDYEDVVNKLLLLQHKLISYRNESIDLKLVLETTKHGVIVWDTSTDQITWDEYSNKLFGFATDIGQGDSNKLLNYVHPDDKTRLKEEFKNVIDNHDKIFETEFRVLDEENDIHIICMKCKSSICRTRDSTILVGACWDVTHERQVEHKLHDTQTELDALIQKAPIGILEVDENHICTFANNYWLDAIGLAKDEYIGKKWYDIIADEFKDKITHEWRIASENHIRFKKDFKIVNSDLNEQRWISTDSAEMEFEEESRSARYLIVAVDTTKAHNSDEEIKTLARYDTLTGLANRALFNEKLQMAYHRAKRSKEKLVLMIVNVDEFKVINDTLGHSIGDEILKELSSRLQSTIRKTDTIARIGGDEFAILFENVKDPTTISLSAKRVFDAIEPAFNISNDSEIHVTASVGIAVSQDDENYYNNILKQADIAVYLAKEHGKNNFQYYTDELNKEMNRKITLGNQLHNAISNSELSVHYQPQYNEKTKKIEGVEALLRWNSNKYGNISPRDFIPIAEDNGMITPLTEWMLYQACSDAKSFESISDELAQIDISFNLSPKSFYSKSIISILKSIIEKTNIEPSRLVAEITEGVLINNLGETNYILKEMKKIGIRIALDDFGTGYSSLSYLKQFPIDILKIDQSFIKNLLLDNDNAAITKAIIAMAQSLKLELIAEGVESKGIADFLTKEGCDICQGYFYSQPVPAFTLPTVCKNLK